MVVVDAVGEVSEVVLVLLVDIHVQVELEVVDLVQTDVVHTGVNEEDAAGDPEGLLVQLPRLVGLFILAGPVDHSDGHGVVLSGILSMVLSGGAGFGRVAGSAWPVGTD